MDIFIIIIIVALVVIVPLALFLGIVGVAILIWSWRRIGPYFVNLGRWSADWRNFVPLSCVGLVGVVLLIVLAAVLPSVLRIPILIVLIVGAVIFIIFATIVWTVRFLHWFWPRYKLRFWNALQWFWDLVWKGIPGQMERRMPGGPSQGRRPPPKQPLPPRPPTGAATTTAASAPAASSPGARRPPVRRSWLDLEWLWRLVWGSPGQGKAKPAQPKAAGAKTPASEKVVALSATDKTGVRAKAGLRPITWRLGLILGQIRSMILGRPAEKPKGAVAKGATQPEGKVESSQATQVPKPATIVAPQAKKEPKRAKKTLVSSAGDWFTETIDSIRQWPGALIAFFRRKPKSKTGSVSPARGAAPSISQGARSAGKGLVGAVQSVRKTFWVGLFWIADRGRASVDSLRRLLRLDRM